MKRTFLLSLFALFALAMNSQTLMRVKQEGGYTNIRSGPGTGYSIVTKYRDGSNIYVGSSRGGWRPVYRNASGGFIGYISSSKVVTRRSSRNSGPNYSAADTRYVRVKPEGGYTNLRSGPGTRYSIVDKVRDGSWIFVMPQQGSWSTVHTSSGKYRGWISNSKIIW